MLIEARQELEALMARVRRSGAFGLDTEFIRERTFRPSLCLLQFGLPDECVLVDPLAVEDLTPVLEVLQDPDVEKIVHAGQQDMEIFFAGNLHTPANVFDTQVAASLLGYGEAVSYTRLVEQVLGVRLRGRETFTDWARRPLTRKQLAYATNDVRYLLPLREQLGGELAGLGREHWLEEELLFYSDPGFYRRDRRTLFRRVSGSGKLRPRELAVLRELTVWREEEAEARNRPRARIISDAMLVEIARRGPTSTADLAALRGVHPQLIKRSGEDIIASVARGLACEPSDYPPALRGRRREEDLGVVVDLLHVVVKQRALEHRVAPSYLICRKDLLDLAESVLAGREATWRVLEGWRADVVGRDLVELLAGRLQVQVDPDTGQVEIGCCPGGSPEGSAE